MAARRNDRRVDGSPPPRRPRWVQPLRFQRNQAGGAAIDQQHLPSASYVDARLHAATAERITSAGEADPHVNILTRPSIPCCSCTRRPAEEDVWEPPATRHRNRSYPLPVPRRRKPSDANAARFLPRRTTIQLKRLLAARQAAAQAGARPVHGNEPGRRARSSGRSPGPHCRHRAIGRMGSRTFGGCRGVVRTGCRSASPG
jgi:hypothetical protein